jgi:hypothetical protein
MQIPHQSPYAKLGKGLSLYDNFNEDDNNIGDAGLLHISKATWTNLQNLSLSSRWG